MNYMLPATPLLYVRRAAMAMAAACALSLSGCASVPRNAPRFTEAPAAPAGYQNVYIYRIGAYPTKRTPTVMVDGKPVFDPPEAAYTVIHLSPGQHWLTTKWSWDTGAPPLAAPLIVKDAPLFIRLSGDFASAGYSFRFGSDLRGLPAAAAEAELRMCCRYMPAQAWHGP
jgi:hypothetical protein